MSEPAVAVRDLSASYSGVPALRSVSFTAPAGAVTAVLGPNGAGKTTALEIIEGFRSADGGTVYVLGREASSSRRDLRSRVGVTLQSGGVAPGASARQVIEHMSRLYAHPLDVDALMERLGIERLGRTPFRRLSGGEQRRVALALAVVGRPELVILDEPTTGLDPQARRDAWALIEDLRTAGASVLLTTHLLDEAQRLADHVVLISAGRVAAEGTVADLVGPTEPFLVLGAVPGLPLHELSSIAPGLHAEAVGSGRYVLRGAVDASTVPAVLAWCSERGVAPSELSMRSRSLEDVYYDLVGAPADSSGSTS